MTDSSGMTTEHGGFPNEPDGEAGQLEWQEASRGDSCPDIHRAALAVADPRPGLTWLDIGCGRGALLRTLLQLHRPAKVAGVDLIDWLDDDLRPHVDLALGRAEQILMEEQRLADRVLLVETLEHLEAPWSVLRAAARCVAPGGRIVVTTPNILNIRHRLEFPARGRLTAFRPDNLPHMTPVLPHVVERLLAEVGMRPASCGYAGRDIVPLTAGRQWPESLHERFPRGTSVSVVMAADQVMAASNGAG